jgi:regulator of PEP synthase PpsR (kinase-PPPase family)
VGVSRTGKTPLSMYLGYLGWMTANVPIVRGIDPPDRLFRISGHKIVGLTIDPERLQTIRGRRLDALEARRSSRDYARLSRILEEIDAAAAIHRRLRCPVLDVTSAAIEESAQRVIELVESRGS